MKKITLLILLSFLVLFVPPLQTVLADDPSPWGEFLNPDGSIQWDKLVDLGVSSQEAGWMDVTLPGGVVIQQQATFHRYQTPSGNVLVLPEPVTLFFMALHPAESGLYRRGKHARQRGLDPDAAGGRCAFPGPIGPTGQQGLHRSHAVLPGSDRRPRRYLVDRELQLPGRTLQNDQRQRFSGERPAALSERRRQLRQHPRWVQRAGEHSLHRPYLRAAALALPGGEHRSGHARAGHPKDCSRPSPGRRAGSGQTRGGYPGFGGHPAGGVHLVRAGPGSSHLPCEQ